MWDRTMPRRRWPVAFWARTPSSDCPPTGRPTWPVPSGPDLTRPPDTSRTSRPDRSRPTPTKPGRPGTGLAYLTRATTAAAKAKNAPALPVFVTGGVTPEKIPALARAGARHFVVVRYLTEAADPEQAARALRQAIDEVLEG